MNTKKSLHACVNFPICYRRCCRIFAQHLCCPLYDMSTEENACKRSPMTTMSDNYDFNADCNDLTTSG